MTERTEAQRLADELDYKWQRGIDLHEGETRAAAAELRRLEAENAALRDALQGMLDLAEVLSPVEGDAVRKARAALSGTAPARVPLTETEIFDALRSVDVSVVTISREAIRHARAIERAHGITGDAA